jgi:hypothetical protein
MVSFILLITYLAFLRYFIHIYIWNNYFTFYHERDIDTTYILPQHDFVPLSCIKIFLCIFNTVIVFVHTYYIILLYSDLPPSILMLK